MEEAKVRTSQEIIQIDGSYGEGGGQVLRTSLALSVLFSKPFEMINIRANRPNPGIQAQHLKAIEASAVISDAIVEGAKHKSSWIRFYPNKIKSGNFRFDIGTAGATSLVLQTLYLPLSFADGTSNLTIIGGTHVSWSPTFDYIKNCWIYFMEVLGLKIKVELKRAGFYPHGGGEIRALINPVAEIKPLNLIDRGKLLKIQIYSAHTNLSDEVAKRQAKAAERILKNYGEVETIIDELVSYSKNTTIAITGIFENSVCCYTNLGEKGKRAEVVAEEACENFLKFINTDSTIDEYMADQILLPLSIASGVSEFTTPKITEHLKTNMDIIKKFVDVEFKISEFKNSYKIQVKPSEFSRES
ncbi:MAG: RNA 3'-terminal phosphate cyclase [Candidatus Kryptonium sp.]